MGTIQWAHGCGDQTTVFQRFSGVSGSYFTVPNSTMRPGTGTVCAIQPGNTTHYLKRALVSPTPTICIAAAFTGTTTMVSNGDTPFFGFWADGYTVNHVTIRHEADGSIGARRGNSQGTLLGKSATSIIQPSTTYHMQAKVTVHDTTGSVEVKLNNATVLSLTNVDTRNGGSDDNIDEMSFGGFTSSQASVGWTFCDMYISDDFEGDLAIKTIRPNGNGNSNQFTGSDGNSTDNYLLVDENPFGTSDYTGSSTVGHKDLYAHGDISTGGTVKAVQTVLYGLKTDGGTRLVKPLTRLSTTEVQGTEFAPATSVEVRTNLFATKPGGGAWTPSDVNSAEFGVEITG